MLSVIKSKSMNQTKGTGNYNMARKKNDQNWLGYGTNNKITRQKLKKVDYTSIIYSIKKLDQRLNVLNRDIK